MEHMPTDAPVVKPSRRRGRPVRAAAVEARHRGLLDAALAVIAREGLAGASTRAIAEEAGINKAMLHYSFADKEALLLAVLAHILDDVRSTLQQAAADAPRSPSERMAAMMRAYWRHVEATPALQRVQYELTLHALSQPAQAALARRQYAGYVDTVSSAVGVPLGDDPDATRRIAELIVATMDGLILQYLADPVVAPARHRLEAAIEALRPLVEPLGHA